MLINKLILMTAAGMGAVISPAFAQHEHHQEPAKDTVNHEMHDMKSMDHEQTDRMLNATWYLTHDS